MGKFVRNGIEYGGSAPVDSALDATSMNAIANKPVAEAITQLNNDLTDTETASLIGSGTKTFSISSTRKRLTIITKKSNVIVGTKEIPTSIFESGDVVPLGNESPVIGTDNIRTGGSLDTNLKGKELYIHGVQDSLGTNHDQLRGVITGAIANGKDIGLAASAEFSDGATLTFNGNNSFTLSVTDSTLSVYVY